MRTRHVTCDGKTETDAFLVARAGFIQPRERPERLFMQRVWNAGAVVLDDDSDPIRAGSARDPDFVAMRDRVVDQIGEAALQGA